MPNLREALKIYLDLERSGDERAASLPNWPIPAFGGVVDSRGSN